MKIGVVIPCYKVKEKIAGVIAGIGPEVDAIYAVDDACPDGSGDFIRAHVSDPRLRVASLPRNLGVGGAVMAGYRLAVSDGMDVIVKVDGDGQMDPTLLPQFVAPIAAGQADYSKGNRFYDISSLRSMPRMRLLGNAGLSILNKLSSGYWDLFDPTNGYTAIRGETARHLPFDKISNRYFFESDMLFRLNLLRAVVVDVPMEAVYADEVSNLKISRVLHDFAYKNVRNFFKRIFYNYFLRDMSVASFELVIGAVMLVFGAMYGAIHWSMSIGDGRVATPGTVMLSALPIILGIQLLLAFVAYDIAAVPRRSLFAKVGKP